MVISEVYLSQIGNEGGRGEKRKREKITKTKIEKRNLESTNLHQKREKKERIEWTEKNDDVSVDPSRNLSSLSEG